MNRKKEVESDTSILYYDSGKVSFIKLVAIAYATVYLNLKKIRGNKLIKGKNNQ